MRYIVPIIFGAIFFAFGWMWRDCHPTEAEAYNDTLTVICYDTIAVRQPVPVDSTVIRYRTIPVSVTDTSTVTVTDTVIEVTIPITQKHYADTLYDAWVSGYDPALDSLKVYPRTIERTIYRDAKPSRWGIGIQAGAGWSGSVQPYIGIGITYTLFDL